MNHPTAANQNEYEIKTETKANVLEHIKQEINIRKENKAHICDVCGHKFRDSYNLKKHVEQKICQRNQNKCNLCRKKFGTLQEVTIHVNEGTCLECRLCETTSKSYASFIQHRTKHKSAKNTVVRNVKNHFTRVEIWSVTYGLIQEKNHSNVIHVVCAFQRQTTSGLTKKGIKVKKLTNALFVTRPFIQDQRLRSM